MSGGEIALKHLLHHLDVTRVEPIVVLGAEGPLADALRARFHVEILPLASEVAHARKGALGFGSLVRLRAMAGAASFVWRLSRLIVRHRASLVHTNSLKSHLLGGAAARIARRPLVWHLRDRIAPDYLPRSVVPVVRALSRILPDFVIANSWATLRTITNTESREAPHPGRYQVIHDGCVLPQEETCGLADARICVGLVGRISPWKGQHVFIKAAALLQREFPGVCFQVIGAPLFSETDYEAQLRKLCRDLDVERNVEFTGFLQDVAAAIARLTVVVHASTIGEPFGQVVIEGMAAGKPVVATDGGGVPEIMVHNATGLLIPMGNERALADAIGQLLRDPLRAREMGKRGRERASELFTLPRVARSVEQVYEQVLAATSVLPPATRRAVKAARLGMES